MPIPPDRTEVMQAWFEDHPAPIAYSELARSIGVVTTGPGRCSISTPLDTLMRRGVVIKTDAGLYRRRRPESWTNPDRLRLGWKPLENPGKWPILTL